jgi:hypothetical protein
MPLVKEIEDFPRMHLFECNETAKSELSYVLQSHASANLLSAGPPPLYLPAKLTVATFHPIAIA